MSKDGKRGVLEMMLKDRPVKEDVSSGEAVCGKCGEPCPVCEPEESDEEDTADGE